MDIDIITSLEIFYGLKPNWDAVYGADPQAQFFLSWSWLAGKLKQYDENQTTWYILAAKLSSEASGYGAFFPIVISVEEKIDDGHGFYNKLTMAGRAEADHGGFICLPDHIEAAALAFAEWFKQQQAWSVFELENILKDDGRMRLFLSHFSAGPFILHEHRHCSDLDAIDHSIIPYVPLPDTWAEYLQKSVSTNTRQKLNRLLRKVEGANEFQVTLPDEKTLDRHIEILLTLWSASWASRKDADECRQLLTQTDHILRHCFGQGCLYFPVLWQGDRPIGTIANLMDFSKKTALFFMGGRDDSVTTMQPGLLLHAYGIRSAIQNGFKVYDFLMGNEAYKYSFGAQERRMTIVVIHRQYPDHPRPALDPRTIPEALQMAAFYHHSNRLAEAKRGYHQVLAQQPEHPEALYGLGVILQRLGEYSAAEAVLQTLVQVQPTAAKAWFSLGALHQIQGQLLAAETAYRQALAQPAHASAISLAIYHNLGYVLQQQGQWAAAMACYEKARTLHPDSIEAEVIWANALFAQGQLPLAQQAHYAALNYELGHKRHQVGDLNAAVEYYQQAIALHPALAEAHGRLGRALQQQNRPVEALACFQAARQLKPDWLEAAVGKANARHALGQLAPAQYPDYAKLNHALGDQFRQADDLTTALDYYHQALVLDPALAMAHCHIGLILQSQGHYAEAAACFQRAQTLQPGFIEAEIGLANLLHAQRKLEPEKMAVYGAMNCDLGHQRQRAGDLKGAIAYFRQAAMMAPDGDDARRSLKLALEEATQVNIKVSCAKRK